MNMPGFTADACLIDKSETFKAQHYKMNAIFNDSTVARVLPQGCIPDPYNPGRYCCTCWGIDFGCNQPRRCM